MRSLDELRLTIPPRKLILGPWLTEKSLSLIHAYRGTGKTHLVIGIALAVASGGTFLKWNAPKPRRVVVLDGEMPLSNLQERFREAAKIFAPVPEGNLLLVAADDQEDRPMPDVSTTEGQEEVTALLAPGDLLILDNISTLCRTGTENEAESWAPVQEWLLQLRRDGVSVILIGHDGKGGTQRGTSKKEDVLDVVIQLKQPSDYQMEHGARFEVRFEKARGFCGNDAAMFEAQLETIEGIAHWKVTDGSQAKTIKVANLLNEGYSNRDIAKMLEIGVASVDRHKKKAKAAGLLSSDA